MKTYNTPYWRCSLVCACRLYSFWKASKPWAKQTWLSGMNVHMATLNQINKRLRKK